MRLRSGTGGGASTGVDGLGGAVAKFGAAGSVVNSLGRRSGSAGGFDWLGAVEDAAGAILRASGSDDDSGSSAMSFGEESPPLDEASPFEYSQNSLISDVIDIAARGVSDANEAECFAEYEFDLEQCNVVVAMTRDPRSLAMCKETAFSNYQRCRGFF
jgi:hypothetical protein